MINYPPAPSYVLVERMLIRASSATATTGTIIQPSMFPGQEDSYHSSILSQASAELVTSPLTNQYYNVVVAAFRQYSATGSVSVPTGRGQFNLEFRDYIPAAFCVSATPTATETASDSPTPAPSATVSATPAISRGEGRIEKGGELLRLEVTQQDLTSRWVERSM